MDLFASKDGRLPIVVELLKSPWLFKGSDLLEEHDAGIGKKREAPVAVAWDERRARPAEFTLDARSYRIDEVVQVWAVERFWWDPRRRISRRVWRVLAKGGTYDLAYDRLLCRWMLVGIQD